MAYSTEQFWMVWDDKEGVALRIGPDADSLGFVEVRTTDAKSAEYWGAIRFTMPKEMAVEVGKAILAAAANAE